MVAMMQLNYEQQVERVLNIHHARIALGLSTARENKDFVLRAAHRLNKAGINYVLRLDTDFDACLVLYLHQQKNVTDSLIRQLFADLDVSIARDGWVINDPKNEWVQVRIGWKLDDV